MEESRKNPVAVFGAGGHAKVIIDLLTVLGYSTIFCVTENGNTHKIVDSKIKFLREDDLPFMIQAIIGIGDNAVRFNVAEKFLHRVKFINAIHPTAVVSSSSILGHGNVIMAGAILNSSVKIGNHCIVNTGALVDHDCSLDDFVSLAPGCCLGGNVQVGRESAICLGTHIINNISIGVRTVIGAGSLVTRSIKDSVLAFGSPCKVQRER